VSPEFSVILPTRGDGAYLPAAAASVLRFREDRELQMVHGRRDGEPDLPDGAKLRKRFGELWHDLAHARLRAGDPAGARSAARPSLRHLPLKIKNYMYLMFSILPGPVRGAVWARAGTSRDGRRRGETA